jgi:hypothetical protein
MDSIYNFINDIYNEFYFRFRNDINYNKLKINTKVKGDFFKSKSKNIYYTVTNKNSLTRSCSFEEFKCKDEFIKDMENFKNEKDCVLKLVIQDDDTLIIKDNQNIIIENPSFSVLNNINSENKNIFIKNLEDFQKI